MGKVNRYDEEMRNEAVVCLSYAFPFCFVWLGYRRETQMLRNIWNLLRKKQKTKNNQKTKESQPWWGLGLFFFGWCVGFFGPKNGLAENA